MEIKKTIMYLILGILVISTYGTSYKNLDSIFDLSLREHISEEDILLKCNNDTFNDISKIECIVDFYDSQVSYKSCSDEGRIMASQIQTPMTTINRGRGCCADAAKYYSYFLRKLDINFKSIDYDIENSTGHIYVIALVTVNNTFHEIRLDTDGLDYQLTAYIGE